MDGQAAFLQLFGDIRITDILVFILAAGYLVPQCRKAVDWLKMQFQEGEHREKALTNAEKLPNWHEQSIEIRDKLQKQIESISNDIGSIKKSMEENESLKMGLQAILREYIISIYNKYKEKGYMPIYARESLKKIYEAYERLGGNDVAHDLYKKMLSWDTDPDGKGETENEDEQ